MKKGIARFTSFCMAAGLTLGGSTGALAAGPDLTLVGVGTSTKPIAAQTVEGTVQEEETGIQEQEAVETEAAAETEEQIQETEPETQAPLDTSMVGTTGFAQCSEYVNIRSTGDTEGEVVGKLSHNAAVEILDVDEYGWYHVRSGNVEGYVASQYIATGAAAEELASTVGYNVAEVGADALNVRMDASEDSDIVTVVTAGQEVEVVEDLGDWLKVAIDTDTYGYISADYAGTSTEYTVAESVEEEQARLEAEYEQYLAEQAAYAEAQSWDAGYTETWYEEPQTQTYEYYDQAAYDAAAQAQADADAAYQAQAEAQAAYESAAQATSDAQSNAEYLYQVYLDAQAQADAAAASADESAVYAAADAAQAAYTDYVNAQAEADAQAQAEADAAYQAELEAANAQAAQEYAETAYEEAEASYYTEEVYTDDAYYDDGTYTDDGSYTEEEYYEEPASTSSLGQEIVNYATQFVGNPYVYGGTSLTGGADCSGFVQSVFANYGIYLPRTAAEQSGAGTQVSLSDIQPGDLLFYSNGGGIGHVTIYMGGGQVVHASNESTGITISDYGYRSPVSAVRVWG